MPLSEFLIWVILLSQSLILDAKGCQPTTQLKWAPAIIKRVFTTFLNDLSCPTWKTRHSFTKKPTYRSKRRIPLGTPFAFMCGSCFTRSDDSVNLSLIHKGVDAEFKPLYSASGDKFHRTPTGLDCLVSYGITAPVTVGGSLTCRFNRGTQMVDEKITFLGVRTAVHENDVITIETEDNRIDLSCPEVQNPSNDIIYAWHGPLDRQEPKIIFPSMRPNITIPVTSQNFEVICSAYDSRSPKEVIRQRYSIIAKRAAESGKEIEQWVVGPGKYKDERPNKITFAFIAIIVGSVIGGIILLVIAGSGIAAFRRTLKATKTPSSNVPLMRDQTYLHDSTMRQS